MHTWRAMERVDLKAGVVGNHDFSGCITTVLFRFLARVLLEREAIFDYEWAGKRSWECWQSQFRAEQRLRQSRGACRDSRSQ